MANRQAGIHQRMAGDLFRRPGAARRARRILIDAGVVLVSAAGSAIIAHAASPSGGVHGWACALAAFLLFLLGVWMAMLALVAGRRFPGAARIAVAIAWALHRHMFGRER
ncbi:unnamed protein product [Urochloa decumbens]|uniref:Uncharacterized protein n=1 Tax=Urochloa decumbens TaxID=240449 RepID=A0ABC9DMS5_9POAL